MKHQNSILIILLATLAACSSAEKKTPQRKTHKRISASEKSITAKLQFAQKANLITGDTFTVDSLAAVITILDAAEIQKRHKASKDDEFYTGADDQMFYMSEAQTYLKKQHLKIVDVPPGYKYLQFRQASGVIHKIKLDTVAFISNLYFFDPHKKLHNVDVTDVEGEYKKYFGK
ncbi:hypothetical protein [Mucilaginibacter dorajii]|uniref:Lipoprotein n=1 Tax=Mucilaginibacter dorajii TaxID=692994 RepID=A0ABP7QM88_9SPHI|nr:hypothetical protein [Mucilaginibacter dorajii]MCS3735884.1 hypothetical protein [Mucilaginibacter dorajii]